jgi:hypothetical protein
MVSDAFIYTTTLAGAGYTTYSIMSMYSFYVKAATTGKNINTLLGPIYGIELYKDVHVETQGTVIPITVGTMTTFVPLAGSTYTRPRMVYSRWHLTTNEKLEMLNNMKVVGDAPIRKYTPAEIPPLYKNILPTDDIKYARQYVLQNPIWYDVKTGVISTNREIVANIASKARSAPATPLVAALTVYMCGMCAISWIMW